MGAVLLAWSACVDVSVCLCVCVCPWCMCLQQQCGGSGWGKASRRDAAVHVRLFVCSAMCACNSCEVLLQGGLAHVQHDAAALSSGSGCLLSPGDSPCGSFTELPTPPCQRPARMVWPAPVCCRCRMCISRPLPPPLSMGSQAVYTFRPDLWGTPVSQ